MLIRILNIVSKCKSLHIILLKHNLCPLQFQYLVCLAGFTLGVPKSNVGLFSPVVSVCASFVDRLTDTDTMLYDVQKTIFQYLLIICGCHFGTNIGEQISYNPIWPVFIMDSWSWWYWFSGRLHFQRRCIDASTLTNAYVEYIQPVLINGYWHLVIRLSISYNGKIEPWPKTSRWGCSDLIWSIFVVFTCGVHRFDMDQ